MATVILVFFFAILTGILALVLENQSAAQQIERYHKEQHFIEMRSKLVGKLR